MEKTQERTLAYKTAQLIKSEELVNVSGGSGATGTTHGTTKQTADSRGNWDVGVDVVWD